MSRHVEARRRFIITTPSTPHAPGPNGNRNGSGGNSNGGNSNCDNGNCSMRI
jgi:hypothetical protein